MSAALLRELRALLQEAERPPTPDLDAMSNEEFLRYWEEVMAPRLRGERGPRTSRQPQGAGYHPYESMTDAELLAESKAVKARMREKRDTDDEVPRFRRIIADSFSDT